MPFKSQAQRRYMYAAAERGDVPKSVVDEFEEKTPKNKKLPKKVKKAESVIQAKSFVEELIELFS